MKAAPVAAGGGANPRWTTTGLAICQWRCPARLQAARSPAKAAALPHSSVRTGCALPRLPADADRQHLSFIVYQSVKVSKRP